MAQARGTNFDTLRSANRRRQKQWDPESKLDLAFKLLEMAGEAGEACNVGKKLLRQSLGLPGSRATLNDLAEELADVVVTADLVADIAGINLKQAIRRKFNKTSEKVGFHVHLKKTGKKAVR